MDYTAHKVNKLIFEGFLNGDRESLTLNTLQNFFNETIENFSEKWILILNDQYDCYDFSLPATHRFYGHKYFILLDYVTKSCYKIGIPNPKDRTSIESRQKSIIIYNSISFSSKETNIVFQKYLKNNKNSYIVSDLKYILIFTFSLLFEDEKEKYSQIIMRTRPDLKESKLTFSEVDNTFVLYNVDEENLRDYKERIFKRLKSLFKIQNANRKDILLKDYSNQELMLLIDLSLGIFDLIRSINEYIRGDTSLYLEWKNIGYPLRFDEFNSGLLEDFKDKAIAEAPLKLIRERISEKIKEINEDSSLRRKIDSDSGFKNYEFRLKEFLAKLQVKTKVIFFCNYLSNRKVCQKTLSKFHCSCKKTMVSCSICLCNFVYIIGFFSIFVQR